MRKYSEQPKHPESPNRSSSTSLSGGPNAFLAPTIQISLRMTEAGMGSVPASSGSNRFVVECFEPSARRLAALRCVSVDRRSGRPERSRVVRRRQAPAGAISSRVRPQPMQKPVRGRHTELSQGVSISSWVIAFMRKLRRRAVPTSLERRALDKNVSTPVQFG